MDGMLPRETKDMYCRECNKRLHDDMTCHACANAKRVAEIRALQLVGKRCCECRASEHPDYDDLVGLCVVKDPDTNKVIQRGYICAGHVEIRTMDGYDVYLNGQKIGQ